MVSFISKSDLKSEEKQNKTYSPHEIFPNIFLNLEPYSEKINFIETAIIWLGAYRLKNENFPKEKCPKCGNIMSPYACGGSILSGRHTIQFYCHSCKEQFVTNSYIEYFRLIYKYILSNQNTLEKSLIYKTNFNIDENAAVY